MFLTDEKREGRVISAYRYSIPIDNPFAWDAVRGQLQLFSDLGIQSALAENVIKELAGAFTNAATAKPIHLVIFAGHSVDLPGRAEPRFPEDKEAEAKTLIRAAIAALRSDEFEIALLASAAPGADILAHESCAELGLRGVMCLPMPAEAIVRLAYQGLDDWRTRFLNLWAVQQRNDGNLILSDRDGLPLWLLRSGVNAWERGNEWVMQMALTWGAKRLTLVTFWDGKREGDAPGGTAHMVRLAEDTGQVHIVRIDSTRLLSPRSVSGFGDGAIAG